MDFSTLAATPGTFANQTQKDLLCTDEVVTQSACFFLGQHDHLNGFFCEAFKHGGFHHLRRAGTLILAQAKIFDIYINNIRYPITMTQVDGLISGY
jgi:hypothetical protein